MKTKLAEQSHREIKGTNTDTIIEAWGLMKKIRNQMYEEGIFTGNAMGKGISPKLIKMIGKYINEN